MKVIVEVSDKFVEIGKGIVLAACKSKGDEQLVIEAAEKVKTLDEPIEVNTNDSDATELDLALAILAIVKVSKEMENKTPNSLQCKLEAMRKQADELRRQRENEAS